jgi:DNA-directed RNA polymerase subunit beta
VFIANKRKIQVGDKMVRPNRNKGVISKIIKPEDMPFLTDGTRMDIILNPLDIPNRMNVGQVFETYLGLVCKKFGIQVSTPAFDGARENKIRELYKQAGLLEGGDAIIHNEMRMLQEAIDALFDHDNHGRSFMGLEIGR